MGIQKYNKITQLNMQEEWKYYYNSVLEQKFITTTSQLPNL